MNEEVDGMAACKAEEALPRGFGTESEIGSQEEIADETDHIARNIGSVDIEPWQQQIVDAQVDSRRETAINTEAHKLPELPVVHQLLRFILHRSHFRVQIYKKNINNYLHIGSFL
jgi:hypothetical protein